MSPLLWDVDRARTCDRSELVDKPVELQPRSGSSAAHADSIDALRDSDGRRVMLHKGDNVELTFDAAAPPRSGWTRSVFVSIRGYYEVDIGGRGLLDPFAVMAHRTGRTSLPRHALALARKR